jgi:aspartyl/asparaginyl beta-hydroxylase (cupin superfamily)
MSLEHPTEGEVAGAAVRLYNIVMNYADDHPDRLPEKLMDYWDPELWDIAERLIVLVGEKVLP